MQIIVALKFVAYRVFEFGNARRGIGISRMARFNSPNRSVAYMFRGLKSGSPATREMRSTPCRFSSPALAKADTVAEAWILRTRCVKGDFI